MNTFPEYDISELLKIITQNQYRTFAIFVCKIKKFSIIFRCEYRSKKLFRKYIIFWEKDNVSISYWISSPEKLNEICFKLHKMGVLEEVYINLQKYILEKI